MWAVPREGAVASPPPRSVASSSALSWPGCRAAPPSRRRRRSTTSRSSTSPPPRAVSGAPRARGCRLAERADAGGGAPRPASPRPVVDAGDGAPPARPAGGPRFSEYRGVRWLARTHAVTTAPSVASLVAVRRSRPRARRDQPSWDSATAVQRPADRRAAGRRGGGAAPSRRAASAHAGGRRPARRRDTHRAAGRLEALPDTADEGRSIAGRSGRARSVTCPGRGGIGGAGEVDGSIRHRVVASTHALVTASWRASRSPRWPSGIPPRALATGC